MSRSPPEYKYNKLASQVGTLSKIVDDIQEEVNLLQSQKGSNERRSQSLDNQRRRGGVNTRPNRSFLQRLRLFRRRRNTGENSARTNSRAKNTRENPSDRGTKGTMTSQKSKRRETTNQQDGNFQQPPKVKRTESSGSMKNERKNRRTQTKFSAENILEFECFVKTSSAQTEPRDVPVKEDPKPNEARMETDNERTNDVPVTPNYMPRSMCNGCTKPSKIRKKDKSASESRKKRGKCSKHCPYLPKNSKRSRDSSKEYRNCCAELCSKVEGIESAKTKKTLVNFEGGCEPGPSKMSPSDVDAMCCKILENIDFPNLKEKKAKSKYSFNIFKKKSAKSKTKKMSQDDCPKARVTKNVLKINKAILTQNPPIIFMPPTATNDNQEPRCQKIECKGSCNKSTSSSDER